MACILLPAGVNGRSCGELQMEDCALSVRLHLPGIRPKDTSAIAAIANDIKPASKEPAKYGVIQSKPLKEPYPFCPQALFLLPDEKKYNDTFIAILTLLADYSPVIQAGGLSSVLIDLCCESNELHFVEGLGQLVKQRFNLPPSLPIRLNKYIAWGASQIAIPRRSSVSQKAKRRISSEVCT